MCVQNYVTECANKHITNCSQVQFVVDLWKFLLFLSALMSIVGVCKGVCVNQSFCGSELRALTA